jgi:hypothetical protein
VLESKVQEPVSDHGLGRIQELRDREPKSKDVLTDKELHHEHSGREGKNGKTSGKGSQK